MPIEIIQDEKQDTRNHKPLDEQQILDNCITCEHFDGYLNNWLYCRQLGKIRIRTANQYKHRRKQRGESR